MDFSLLKDQIKTDAFSDQPLSILNPRARDAFAMIMEIVLLETSGREIWSAWQARQFESLAKHAAQRSPTWRKRFGLTPPNLQNLKNMPVLSRRNVAEVFKSEGSLIPKGANIRVALNASSGSSGTPAQFYVTSRAGQYNGARGIVQDLIEDRDFRESRSKVSSATSDVTKNQPKYFSSKTVDDWLGILSGVFEGGRYRKIRYLNSQEALLEELRMNPPAHLVCSPAVMDVILAPRGIDFLKDIGTKRWIQFAGHRAPGTYETFREAGIEISANYSSEETGPIAFECASCPGHYHVAVSNVIVEEDSRVQAEFEGETLSRLLVTHLHSFASPFIRYDIGDFGRLHNQCPCGKDIPTLSNIYGRAKQFLFMPDGRYMSFYFDAKDILSRVQCDEFQIRQTDLETIEVTLSRKAPLSDDEEAALRAFFHFKTGYEFNLHAQVVDEIDWRNNPKQLGFISEVSGKI